MNQTDRKTLRQTKGRPFLRWSPNRWMFVLVMLSLIWRLVRYALDTPIWGDEAFIGVNFITRSFGELTGPLDHPQIVPAGFLWLEWIASRLLGTGEMALRFLPLVFGVTAAIVFWRFAPKIVAKRFAMAGVLIFAASYYPVRHSVEVKSYSLDLLIALVLTWQAWVLCHKPTRPLRWIVFTLCGVAAVWFSYPSVFIIAGAMCVLGYCLYQKRAGIAWYAGWALSGALMAGSFLAMYKLVAVGQDTHHAGIEELKGWASAFPPLTNPVGLIEWFIRAHTGNMFAYPFGGNHYGSTATFLLVIIGIIAMWRTRQRLALMLLLSPFSFMFIAAAMKKYPYGDSARVEQHIAPAACLLAGAGLVALLNHGWKKRGVVTGMRVTGIVMLVILGIGVARDVREPYKKVSDKVARQLAKDLAAQTRPGDRWVFFCSIDGTDQAPSFIPWGGSFARLRYDLLQYRPDGIALDWAPPADAVPQPKPGTTTWLFVYRDNDLKNNPFPAERTQHYLDAVNAHLGAPTLAEYPMQEDDELLKVYRYRNPSDKDGQ